MTSSTWGGFFKTRRHAPEQAATKAHDDEDQRRGVQVAFESLEYDDGQPFIALVFLRDGVPIAPPGRVFTFDLAPGTPKLEADTLASLLSRRVTHLVETRVGVATSPDAEAP
jgi:hypothetical protein